MLFSLCTVFLLLGQALACPQHDINLHSNGMVKRNSPGRGQDWTYVDSYNWHTVNKDYALCRTGTQQSPIALSATPLLSLVHIPTFNYSQSTHGELFNTGHGPGFTLKSANITDNPSMIFDDEEVYLIGWHIHTPSEHIVEGVQSKAELHLVHANSEGKARAVLGFRVDPGLTGSLFFDQWLEKLPTMKDESAVEMEVDIGTVLSDAGMMKNFWTYEGSLTSPPCTEGLRWFVAADILRIDVAQMKKLLESSMYSARVLQSLWEQNVNM